MIVRRLCAAGAIALCATNAAAATAYWTGEMKMVQSVTGMMVWNCKYQYAGQYFWRAFSGNCPNSVEVQ